MATAATDSSIDIAYWFFGRAEDDGIYLETEKLQHLLFLAQVHYAMNYNMELLMPSLFLCDKTGFYEPNLNRMFAQGRPFMPRIKFPAKINLFLEGIWQKYGAYTERKLSDLIRKNPAYSENYTAGASTIVPLKNIVDHYNAAKKKAKSSQADNRKKILLSQNGPVVVTQWLPRKVEVINSKGDNQ